MTAYPARFTTVLLLALSLAACGEPMTTPDAFAPTVDAASVESDAFVVAGEDAFAPPPDAFVPSEPDAGPATVSFASDILPILEANCRGSGCHGTPQTFFLSRTGRACMGMPFVVPFDPEASFVVDKLEGTQPASCGMRMPRGRTPLSSDDMTLIRTWIAEGARNN